MTSDIFLDRRGFALAVGATLLLPACVGTRPSRSSPTSQIQAIEQTAGGRLGAFVIDTGSGRSFGWRADELFCHCSTFKLSLAAMALRESDAGRIDLAEPLAYSQADIVAHSPVVLAHLTKGRLPIRVLAEAVQVTSDNTAANLLMRRFGGPEALTRFWREAGDRVSRLDGYEPDINVIPPGTQENSTTPRAMARTVERLVTGDVLTASSRALLGEWMERTRTGMNRIRASIPADWRGLDKTGTYMHPAIGNKTNDLAVLYPPKGRAPVIVAGYFERPVYSEAGREEDEAVLKALGEIAAAWAG